MPQEVAGGFVGVSRRISGLEELAFCQVEGWLVTIQSVNLDTGQQGTQTVPVAA